MILAFDLDDVICNRPNNKEHLGKDKYIHCKPIIEMVNIVNECYDRGHHIKIYTARGMSVFSGDVTKIYNELYKLTSIQLETWGIKYHELVMGKIHYDLLVDDKAINITNIKSISDIENFKIDNK